MNNIASIVIPTHNRVKELSRCLELIMMQELKGWEIEVIIIIDGASDNTERTIMEVQKMRHLDLRYIRQERLGPAVARNKGIREAKGDIVIFLDDDSFAQPGWFVALIKPFLSDDNQLAGVRGNVIADDDDPYSLSSELGRYIYISKAGTTATNNIAYRKSVLIEVGLFDERFRHAAGEDTDLGNRIKDLRYRIAYVSDAVVRHPHENSWEAFWRKSIIRGRGGAVYFKKWILRKPLRGLTALKPWKAWCYMPLLFFSYEKLPGSLRRSYLIAYQKKGMLKGFLEELFLGYESNVG